MDVCGEMHLVFSVVSEFYRQLNVYIWEQLTLPLESKTKGMNIVKDLDKSTDSKSEDRHVLLTQRRLNVWDQELLFFWIQMALFKKKIRVFSCASMEEMAFCKKVLKCHRMSEMQSKNL